MLGAKPLAHRSDRRNNARMRFGLEPVVNACARLEGRASPASGDCSRGPAGPDWKPIARALLRWFGREAEDLPWRRTRDPYAIWISEIMLQQTQVATVIPYYERWLEALPDVASLAGAPVDRLLKLWEGLGYYSRVRNLQRAARLVLARHAGRLPWTGAELLELPGVGRYTAGAIASIAFNQPAPVLDGNVIRVLARVVGWPAPVSSPATRKELWSFAGQLVRAASGVAGRVTSPRARPVSGDPGGAYEPIGERLVRETPHGALNQALMELGRRVCRPQRALCAGCPLARRCVARREGKVGQLPDLGPRLPTIRCLRVALVLECRGRYRVERRPAGGVNGGLWEFPNLALDPLEPTTADGVARLWPTVDATSLRPLITVRHSITRHRITLEAWQGTAGGSPDTHPGSGVWASLDDLDQLPFASAHRRVLVALQRRRNPAPVSRQFPGLHDRPDPA